MDAKGTKRSVKGRGTKKQALFTFAQVGQQATMLDTLFRFWISIKDAFEAKYLNVHLEVTDK